MGILSGMRGSLSGQSIPSLAPLKIICLTPPHIFEEGKGQYFTASEQAFIDKAYSQCKNISIDYGVMEKAANVHMVKGKFDWSDLGSWNSLHEIQDKDKNGNVVHANALLYDSKNCYVKGPADTLIVTQDLDGYLVTQSDNVILICKKDAEKEIQGIPERCQNKRKRVHLILSTKEVKNELESMTFGKGF